MRNPYSFEGPGYVYLLLTDDDKKPVYIGSTCDLSSRLVQHFRYKDRKSVPYEYVSKVMYCRVNTRRDATEIESKLIQEINPRCNNGYPLSKPHVTVEEISRKMWHMVSTNSMCDRDEGKPSSMSIKMAIGVSDKFSNVGGNAIMAFINNAKEDTRIIAQEEQSVEENVKYDASLDAVLKAIIELAEKKEKDAEMLRATAELLKRTIREA